MNGTCGGLVALSKELGNRAALLPAAAWTYLRNLNPPALLESGKINGVDAKSRPARRFFGDIDSRQFAGVNPS